MPVYTRSISSERKDTRNFINIGSGVDLKLRYIAKQVAYVVDYDGRFIFGVEMTSSNRLCQETGGYAWHLDFGLVKLNSF